MTSAEPAVPPHVLEAIREQARIDVAQAPPLKPWQLDILRPMLASRRKAATSTARRRAA